MDQQIGYPAVFNSKGGSDDFSGNFSCLNHSASVTGYGTITNIGADYIEAKDNKGRNNRYHFSACSRVESATATPQVGQGFYYEAVPSSADGFNLIAASCI